MRVILFCLLTSLTLLGCKSGAVLRYSVQLDAGREASIEFIPPADGEILLRNRGPGKITVSLERGPDGPQPEPAVLGIDMAYRFVTTGFQKVWLVNSSSELAAVDYAIRLESVKNTTVRLKYLPPADDPPAEGDAPGGGQPSGVRDEPPTAAGAAPGSK